LPAAILTTLLALLAAQAEEVGRLYAREGAMLRAAPAPTARVVRALLDGDELVPVAVEPDEIELRPRKLPEGWLAFSTVEMDSQRVYVGYLPVGEVSVHGPDAARRRQVLRSAAQSILGQLASLSGQFAALRERHDLPALVALMDAQITPRLLDAQDIIGELRDLSDPQAPLLSRDLAKQAGRFKP
jgi:hypothetical protein